MTLLNSCQVLKSWPNLSKFFALQALFECLGILLNKLGLKVPEIMVSQAQEPVDEVAPLSQIPGLNLTQFNEIGTFRPNLLNKIPKHSNRACRAKTYSIKLGQLFNT